MLDIQLDRRNLSPIQRIKVTEKYRPIYEKQAAINKSLNGGDKKSESVKLPTPIDKIDVREKLASVAGVSGKTYSMGKKILDSDNEDYKLTNHKTGKRSNVKVDDYSLTLDMAKELSMVEKGCRWCVCCY